MTESPFATTSRILSEASNSFDLLRIIAGESNGLRDADRNVMRQAATELESAQYAHLATYRQLLDVQAKLIAVNDQLIAARKATLPADSKWSMSTGWMRGETLK